MKINADFITYRGKRVGNKIKVCIYYLWRRKTDGKENKGCIYYLWRRKKGGKENKGCAFITYGGGERVGKKINSDFIDAVIYEAGCKCQTCYLHVSHASVSVITSYHATERGTVLIIVPLCDKDIVNKSYPGFTGGRHSRVLTL